MKSDYSLKIVELDVARDSINILVNKVETQDTLINKLVNVIEVKDTIISLKDNIITQRELQIDNLNENNKKLKRRNTAVERQRNYSMGFSSALVIILLIMVL